MYEKKYYSHLGVYKCKKCDFSRPNINIFVDQYSFDINGGAKMHVMSEQWGDIWLEVDLPGKYNMYNVLTACVSACVLEVEKELIAESVSRFKPVFGRFEKVMLADGKILHLMLSKNPTGFNELLRTILDSGENLNFVFVLNDNYADGRDVSWIWDVDFEWLKERINWLAVSGMRADDMVLRMKYAGLDMDKVGKEKNIKQLVDDLEKIESKENIYVMATYTGMLEFRNVLVNKGLVKDFWRKQ